MKHILPVLAFTLLTAVSGLCKPVSPVKAAHDASYHIGFETTMEENMCSATATGPNVLLIATHCELPTDDIQIDMHDGSKDNDGVGHIVKRIRDKSDHTLLFISGQSFKSWSEINLHDPLEQNEDVFVIGNPADWTDVFYRGYIQGIKTDNSLAAAFGQGEPDEIIMDLRIWHGDSGAGVFNNKGELIGVLTGTDHPSSSKDAPVFSFMYKMSFTQAQVDEAIKFTAPGFIPPPKKDKDDAKDSDEDK